MSQSAVIQAKLPTAPDEGLSRIDIATHVRVGVTKFDELVADGRMPRPRVVESSFLRITRKRGTLPTIICAAPNFLTFVANSKSDNLQTR